MGFVITRYGKIPKEELIVEIIPEFPIIPFSQKVNYLYDSEVDTISAPISIKLSDNRVVYLSESLDCEISEVKWIRAGSSTHNIKIPTTLNPKLAYLVGYLYGDGGFKDIKNSYEMSAK